MPRKFVRDSKFRHVYGDPYKKTKLYENIDISKNSWDGGSYCTVNSKFLAIVLEGYGGGCFIVLPLEQVSILLLEVQIIGLEMLSDYGISDKDKTLSSFVNHCYYLKLR